MTQAQLNLISWESTLRRYIKKKKKYETIPLFKTLNGLAPWNIFTNRTTPYTLRYNEGKPNLPKPRTNYFI